MKMDVLEKLPAAIIKALARKKGYALREGEDIDEVRGWLFAQYRRSVDDLLGRGANIVEVAGRKLYGIRTALGISPPTALPGDEAPAAEPGEAEVFVTPTLARIYEKQGLRREAEAIYRTLLEREPQNAAWKEALGRLASPPAAPEAQAAAAGAPAGAGEEPAAPFVGGDAIAGAHVSRREPWGLLDLAEPPRAYGRDTMALMAVDPRNLYAYWEVTPEHAEHVRRTVGSGGELVLRLYEILMDEGGVVETGLREEQVGGLASEFFLHGVSAGGFYRGAVGYRIGRRFYPLVHSPLEATPGDGMRDVQGEEWMEVDQAPLQKRRGGIEPLRTGGRRRLGVRELALLRLKMAGKAGASRLTGIPVERLERLFDEMACMEHEGVRPPGSSWPARS